jgi:hypothetical protein
MRTFEITNKKYFNSNKQTDKHELSEFLYFIQLTINDLDQAAERIIHWKFYDILCKIITDLLWNKSERKWKNLDETSHINELNLVC